MKSMFQVIEMIVEVENVGSGWWADSKSLLFLIFNEMKSKPAPRLLDPAVAIVCCGGLEQSKTLA